MVNKPNSNLTNNIAIIFGQMQDHIGLKQGQVGIIAINKQKIMIKICQNAMSEEIFDIVDQYDQVIGQ